MASHTPQLLAEEASSAQELAVSEEEVVKRGQFSTLVKIATTSTVVEN